MRTTQDGVNFFVDSYGKNNAYDGVYLYGGGGARRAWGKGALAPLFQLPSNITWELIGILLCLDQMAQGIACKSMAES